jgi:hypothetical protein
MDNVIDFESARKEKLLDKATQDDFEEFILAINANDWDLIRETRLFKIAGLEICETLIDTSTYYEKKD